MAACSTHINRTYRLMWPSPHTTTLSSSARASPRARGRVAARSRFPFQLPCLNSEPSTRRVEALTRTAAASTSHVKRRARPMSFVTMDSAKPVPWRRRWATGLVESGDDTDGEDVVEVLGIPVLGGGRLRRGNIAPRLLIAEPRKARDGPSPVGASCAVATFTTTRRAFARAERVQRVAKEGFARSSRGPVPRTNPVETPDRRPPAERTAYRPAYRLARSAVEGRIS